MASRLFRRIVVPTDFSGCSEEAWALARRIAGAVGSEIVLVHVFVEPPSYGEASFPVDSAWQVIESARKWVEEELEKWAGAARRSEERRVGKECSLTCRSRWAPYH